MEEVLLFKNLVCS